MIKHFCGVFLIIYLVNAASSINETYYKLKFSLTRGDPKEIKMNLILWENLAIDLLLKCGNPKILADMHSSNNLSAITRASFLSKISEFLSKPALQLKKALRSICVSQNLLFRIIEKCEFMSQLELENAIAYFFCTSSYPDIDEAIRKTAHDCVHLFPILRHIGVNPELRHSSFTNIFPPNFKLLDYTKIYYGLYEHDSPFQLFLRDSLFLSQQFDSHICLRLDTGLTLEFGEISVLVEKSYYQFISQKFCIQIEKHLRKKEADDFKWMTDGMLRAFVDIESTPEDLKRQIRKIFYRMKRSQKLFLFLTSWPDHVATVGVVAEDNGFSLFVGNTGFGSENPGITRYQLDSLTVDVLDEILREISAVPQNGEASRQELKPQIVSNCSYIAMKIALYLFIVEKLGHDASLFERVEKEAKYSHADYFISKYVNSSFHLKKEAARILFYALARDKTVRKKYKRWLKQDVNTVSDLFIDFFWNCVEKGELEWFQSSLVFKRVNTLKEKHLAYRALIAAYNSNGLKLLDAVRGDPSLLTTFTTFGVSVIHVFLYSENPEPSYVEKVVNIFLDQIKLQHSIPFFVRFDNIESILNKNSNVLADYKNTFSLIKP